MQKETPSMPLGSHGEPSHQALTALRWMEDEVFFVIVDLARSKLFPLGFTLTAYIILKEKFESTTQADRCEVKLDFESMKIKGSQDPEVFVHRIEVDSSSSSSAMESPRLNRAAGCHVCRRCRAQHCSPARHV